VTTAATATIHASAVLVGAHAVLIRGPAGAGKSRLAFDLILAAEAGSLAFARLVGDDRVHLEPHHGRLIVRPAQSLAGPLEVRGAGIRKLAFEPIAAVGLVVDLAAADGERFPGAAAREIAIDGIRLPRLAVAPDYPALPLILALHRSAEGAAEGRREGPAGGLPVAKK
jgi:serine kinase of HPr protein (carbohydrate metabolism regulator)